MFIRSMALSVAVLAAGGSAVAQSASWSLDGQVGVVSDYRYRGYSLSDSRPALQGGLTLSHGSGFYGDVFASTIEPVGIGDDGDGARLEVTATAGWAGQAGGLDIDVGVSAYRYPDGDGVNYVEIPLQVGRTTGVFTWMVGASYAPSQTALGDEANRYGWAGLDYAPPDWPVSLAVRLGHEDGAFAPEGKTDWVLSASRAVGPATLELAWTDSDLEKGAVVLSAVAAF
ncbi:hypothetical protein GVN24_29990 [Rhizobium sp. CRIBSB]|nr:hypothetical protein [Rhizobium sp. CRIBSB]